MMGVDPYYLMDKAALESPIGANRLLYLPYLMGERSPINDTDARGTFIGLSMDNSLDWIECFWSIILCGYSPLLINLRLSREMVERAIADCSAKAVISDQRIYSVKTLMQDMIGYADERFSLDTFGTEILVMSSGTSRHVKLCAYSAEELYHQIKGSYGIVTECDLIKRHYKDRLKLLTFLPFYHVFGLLAVYIWFSFWLIFLLTAKINNFIFKHNRCYYT